MPIGAMNLRAAAPDYKGRAAACVTPVTFFAFRACQVRRNDNAHLTRLAMSKFKIGRVGKYFIPVAVFAPLAVGVALTIDQFAPEKAEASLGANVESGERLSITSAARMALLIGNADYPDANAPLSHPLRDMHALADELRRTGFAVEVKQNLGKEDLQRTIDAFQAKVMPGSTALLAFSGFGLQTGRQNYMIPVNAQIWKESDISREGVSLASVLAGMNSRGANVKLAIIDASRRNPFERRFRGYSAGLAPITGPTGSLIISAAPADKIADDVEGGNGLLVGELIKEIASAGVSAEQIFERTRTGVSRASHGEQVPVVSSSLVGDFAFVQNAPRYAGLNASQKDAAGAVAPKPLPPAPKLEDLTEAAPAPKQEPAVQSPPAAPRAPRIAPPPPSPVVQRAESSPTPPPPPPAKPSQVASAPDDDDDEDEDEVRSTPKSGYGVKRSRKANNNFYDYDRRPRVRYTNSGRHHRSGGWSHGGGGGGRYSMNSMSGVGY
jgi:hypothetical protein